MATARTTAALGALLAFAVAGAACGRSPGEGAADGGADTGTAALDQPPDLRFKWVGVSFELHDVRYTNAGTAAGGTVTKQGSLGVTPLTLSGEVASEYSEFSVPADLGAMSLVATSSALPGLDQDLVMGVDSRSIVVSLDSSHEAGASVDRAQGVYNALLNGSIGGVTYVPFVRATMAASELRDWAATHGAAGHVGDRPLPCGRRHLRDGLRTHRRSDAVRDPGRLRVAR